MTALIVEGDPLVRRIMAETLRTGFPSLEVGEAEDAAAGRREARLHPPALAFINLDLPDDGGLRLVKQIRRLAPASVIAAWVRSDSPSDREEARARGATHLLIKTEVGIGEIKRLAEEAVRRQE